ncbi:hypothetical protein [Tengunoibacter tsumagoiensis]|uniref:Uncharacterized protein n=1 Tax=Tengunoibacter tsumagoiensis TaxID=2014871 RepID=A0A402A8F3_9CHLR|nr:hypothetical protein [Tengunoibacter tsumagoiensis]GCE15241.1 hypothetical protein KTT_51000 [Tengunoibacter tsumagoiensis]
MKIYFKHDADLGLMVGTAYFEFEDEWPTRQVEVYGEKWLCSNKEYHPGVGPGLADQPLSFFEFKKEHEINKTEFELIWAEAIKRS